jgi:uncharacterized protein YndB with AHSA1/START domain
MTWEVNNTRLFGVTPDQLFEAFSDPARLAQWWGPNGFTNTFTAFDFRPGGLWNLTMYSTVGAAFANESEFIEIIPLERIVLVHHRPMHRFQMTMRFEEDGNGTRLTWLMAFDNDEGEAMRAFIAKANEENFDRLAAHLNGGTAPANTICLTRVFAASRDLVFRAWTEPQRLADWWGRHDFTNPICEMDARVGGKFRIVMRSPDGMDYPLCGTVREIDSPSRLLLALDLRQYPEAWREIACSGLTEADAALINEHELAIQLTEVGPSTQLDLQICFPSSSLRDAFLNCGIQSGWNEGLDSLTALLTASPHPAPSPLDTSH